MRTTIIVCDTCKRDGWEEKGQEKTDGEGLAEKIEAAASGADITVRRHSCLMGCSEACNIAIHAEGKLQYFLGRFDDSAEDAAGIVEYATLHQASETGQVPFKQWPQAIKGHFRARMPVLDDSAE